MVRIHSDRIGQQVFSEPRGPTRKQQQVTKSGIWRQDYVLQIMEILNFHQVMININTRSGGKKMSCSKCKIKSFFWQTLAQN